MLFRSVIVGLYYGLISFQKKSLQQMAEMQTEKQNKIGNAQRLVNGTPQIQKNLDAATSTLRAIEGKIRHLDQYRNAGADDDGVAEGNCR